jgi:hypothetical protein
MVYRDSFDPPKAIIFDWDDTICPSSFVDRYGIEHIDHLPSHVSARRRPQDNRLTNDVENIGNHLICIYLVSWKSKVSHSLLFRFCLATPCFLMTDPVPETVLRNRKNGRKSPPRGFEARRGKFDFSTLSCVRICSCFFRLGRSLVMALRSESRSRFSKDLDTGNRRLYVELFLFIFGAHLWILKGW